MASEVMSQGSTAAMTPLRQTPFWPQNGSFSSYWELLGVFVRVQKRRHTSGQKHVLRHLVEFNRRTLSRS